MDDLLTVCQYVNNALSGSFMGVFFLLPLMKKGNRLEQLVPDEILSKQNWTNICWQRVRLAEVAQQYYPQFRTDRSDGKIVVLRGMCCNLWDSFGVAGKSDGI